jgi:hypothetical protein
VLGVLAPVTYPGRSLLSRSTPLLVHLTAGSLAYIAGYLLTRAGRSDAVELSGRLLRRPRNA